MHPLFLEYRAFIYRDIIFVMENYFLHETHPLPFLMTRSLHVTTKMFSWTRVHALHSRMKKFEYICVCERACCIRWFCSYSYTGTCTKGNSYQIACFEKKTACGRNYIDELIYPTTIQWNIGIYRDVFLL